MSGYGGNLTYPDLKVFYNSIGTLDNTVPTPDTGAPADQTFRILDDGKLGVRVLHMAKEGSYIPKGTWTKVEQLDAVARQVRIKFDNRAPCDECTAELGFTVVAKAQHPGVFNDNFYGQRRTYAHKFDRLDPIAAGLISDMDLMRAYADVNQQITDDSGRFNGQLQGNIESVVNAVVAITFSADISAGTVDVPAAGLYGVSFAAASDYVSLAGANTVVQNVGTPIPGYGFIVHVPGAETVDDHYIQLTTKDEYFKHTTFNVEKFDGFETVIAAGNFELLPWEEVFREFTHMPHDVPLSNHHYVEKPVNTAWAKYILETDHSNASFHGASHGESYLQRVIFFVPKNDASIADLETILAAWSA